jgi:hypothetical protein
MKPWIGPQLDQGSGGLCIRRCAVTGAVMGALVGGFFCIARASGYLEHATCAQMDDASARFGIVCTAYAGLGGLLFGASLALVYNALGFAARG